MVDFEIKDCYKFDDLLRIMEILRAPDGCMWDPFMSCSAKLLTAFKATSTGRSGTHACADTVQAPQTSAACGSVLLCYDLYYNF